MPRSLGVHLGQVPAVQRGWRRLDARQQQRYVTWIGAGRSAARQQHRVQVAALLISRGERLPTRLRRFRLTGQARGGGYDVCSDPGAGGMVGGYLDL